MESDNGLEWQRPHLELPDPAPINFGASLIDEGPSFRDWMRRYKMVWDRNGVMMATSPDGRAWRAVRETPVVRGTGDAVCISRDPYRNRYIVVARTSSGERRVLGQATSEDAFEWTRVAEAIVPDDGDPPGSGFYSMSNLLARGGLLIGLLKVLVDGVPAEPRGTVGGIGYTVLAWTRDGTVWNHDHEAFLDRNAEPNTWDRAVAWGDCLLPVDDEVFIYYGGYRQGHKIDRFTDRQLGFARIMRDRYVARQAGPDGGVLRTPPVVLDGSPLTVNADVAGELRVRILDLDGRPIWNFDATDCLPVRGDSLAHPVRWRRAVRPPADVPLQLEFLLRDASLYALGVGGG